MKTAKKSLPALFAILISLCICLGSSTIALADDDEKSASPLINHVEVWGDDGSIVVLDVDMLSETVFAIHTTENIYYTNNENQFVYFDLPDETNITAFWDATGLESDLAGTWVYDGTEYKAYDEETKAFCFRAALKDNRFPEGWFRNWIGCYYFKLTDDRIITLIYDSQAYGSNGSFPEAIALYDNTTGDVLDEFSVQGLYERGQTQQYDYNAMFRGSISSISPIVLKAWVYGEAGNKNEYSYLRIMNNSVYGWKESFSASMLVNGVLQPSFYSSTYSAENYSIPFALEPGLNVVEICVNSSGWMLNTKAGYHWLESPNRKYTSVVFLIEYDGEKAELPAANSDASIIDGSLSAFLSGNTNQYFQKREVTSDGAGGFVFSAPSTYREAPKNAKGEVNVNLSYKAGAVFSVMPSDPRAIVEIVSDNAEDFIAGGRVGSCYGLNIFLLPESNQFTIRVTSADGTVTKEYPVTVVFADSSTSLNELSVDGAALDEPFNGEVYAYYLAFDEGSDTASISFAVPGNQTVAIDGVRSEGSAEVSTDALVHTLTVTAEDGLTTKTYYFITQLSDGSIPYFETSPETLDLSAKLLKGYWEASEDTKYYSSYWPIFMAEAAGVGADESNRVIPVDFEGKYIYNIENHPNRQATDPAACILEAVIMGENPYSFDPDGDGESINFVERLEEWSSGGAWANNIWYNMAAKAVGIQPLFETSFRANAVNKFYDLDMRAWTIASLYNCFGIDRKAMVPYIESLHNVQSTFENGQYSDEKYIGLWRNVTSYGSDGNTYTIGTVLSAIAAVGGDPNTLFAYSYEGTEYNPLNQIGNVLWDEQTGMFTDSWGVSDYAKDMIIGLGDILHGSNMWDRLTLTEEKYAALLEKAAETGVDTADMPAYGEEGYGKAYYDLYAVVADELEASGDTSMRPKVIWGLPDEIFVEHVEALPDEADEGFTEYVESLIEEYEGLDAINENIISYLETTKPEIIAAYRDAVAAALKQQDDTGDTADFYTRVMALPDALIITEESRDEVDALRYLYDHMSDGQQALVDWAGKSVLLKLMAAEAVLGTPEDEEPETMTIYFTLLGAPDDGEDGEVNTLMDENLEQWYETEQTFNAESLTAEQVFRVIMGEAGIAWRGNSQNQYGSLYVSGIQSPLTGEWMEEFTTTNNSGWMYTVNGTHPSVGLSNWTLYDGDEFVMHFTDDYTKEEDAAQYADQESGGSSGGTETDEVTDTIVLEAEETEDGAAAALDGETAENWLAGTEDDSELTLRVDGEEDKTTLTLEAEAVAALAEADTEVRVELGDTALLLDAETMDELAKTGADVTLTVETGEDGETKLSLTAGGKALDAALPVELPASENAQVLAILRKGGQQEIVRKSVVSGGKVYAEIPAGVTVKAVENKKAFEDVKDGDWFAAAVDFAASHELFQGVGDGLFAPKSQMTRAMLVTVLYRLSDEPAAAGGTSFDDVVPGSWYADAVAWASAEGIVLGNGEGFAPNDNITREQIATILYRYMKYLGEDVSAKGDVSSFSDGGEVSAWAKDAMAWAVKVGLFQGNADGTLNPGGEATRAEVATLMERLVKLLVLK